MTQHIAASQPSARDDFEFYAPCPAGFEADLADELREAGLSRVRPLKGRVSFQGPAIDGERACLESRLASRVFTVVGRFEAADAEGLYEGAYGLPWERVLRRGATIAVNARGTTPKLRNSHFTALRVKDAVCDRLVDEAGARAGVDLDRPDARIAVTVNRQRVSIALDLSGDPLFRRLPRAATMPGAAAHVLRPDYAALLLRRAGFPGRVRSAHSEGAPAALVDASCAGGGAALEAAQMLLERAPGLARRHWGFQGWAEHDPGAWSELAQAAQARADAAEAGSRGTIIALAESAGAATYAERVLHAAGVASVVSVAVAGSAQADEALATLPGDARAALVADALERPLASIQPLAALILRLRDLPALAHAPLAALGGDELLSRALGARPDTVLGIKPNNEEAVLMSWADAGTKTATGVTVAARVTTAEDAESAEVAKHPAATTGPTRAATPIPTAPAEPRRRPVGARRGSGASDRLTPAAEADLGAGKRVPVLMEASQQFANRLKKNARLRRKWARRTGVTCYRVYDADLPDYSAAIDLYEGSAATPGRWLVIAEYAAPKTIEPELAQARMLDILAIAPEVLEVAPEHVYARSRTRSRGGSQYAKLSAGAAGRSARTTAAPAPRPLIEEGGLTFEVDFSSYLDTGIFLDHRVTRGLVRDRARELAPCRFLNLFAYTGTATCYAADGGAVETVTVDLSNTYLDWTERNLATNGFTGPEHHIVRADVLAWIDDMRRAGHTWNLIFCDPPTFSNSAKMGERTWDVQRDHVELLHGVTDLLDPSGLAIFSCNLRGFRPDRAALEAAGIELTDITARTIPEDFARNQKIHHCYEVRRG